MKSYGVIIQVKPPQQYTFTWYYLFSMWFKLLRLWLESYGRYYHSNKTSSVVLSHMMVLFI